MTVEDAFVVDLAGWQTAFAIRFSDANQAITSTWDNVSSGAKGIDLTYQGLHLKAELLPWQLSVGGDGRNVWLDIPMRDGFLDGFQGRLELTGAIAKVEINLDYVPDPYDNGIRKLKVDPESKATNVRDVVLKHKDELKEAMLKLVFNHWLAKHLGEFNHIFHTFNLSSNVASDPHWKFIRPTSVSYAVTDLGTLDSSVFGVLTMLEDRPIPAGDPHTISPYAIPAGCNCGFNISGPTFLRDMLLTAAGMNFERPSWVRDSKNPDVDFQKWLGNTFSVGNDGMTVWNTERVKFGTFEDDKGDPRDMYVDAKSFRLSITYSQLEFEFIDLSYEYSSGIFVHINYKQYFTVKLVDATDEHGNPMKVFGLESGTRDCTVSITKSKAVQRKEIIAEIGLTVVGMILGGLAGEIVGGIVKGVVAATRTAAAAAVEATAEAGAAGAAEVSMEIPLETASTDSVQLTTEAAEEAATEASTGLMSKMKGLFSRAVPKIIGSILGGITGGLIGDIPKFIELSAKGHFDKLPVFDSFAQKVMSAHTWPTQKDYNLKSLGLHSSLQIGGDIVY